MPNKVEFKKGQKVGSCIYLYETDPYISPSGLTRKRQAVFQCKCGSLFTTPISLVNVGHTKSCGCNKSETVIKRNLTHGLTGHVIYRKWNAIINRCTNKKAFAYHRYGGRGITICDEWRNDFKAFYDHVTQLPHYGEPGMTLDREKNDQGYKPGNVRWVDRHTQSANRSGNWNKHGYKGLVLSGERYRAIININRVPICVGVFGTPKEAAIARNEYIIDNNLTEYPLSK